MPTSTTNYGLIKPGTDDPILIGQINDNMDTIDTVLKDHSDKIDAAALGIKFKGEVNYYSNLPNDAEIGDAYTVKYAGSSGTTPDGTEYVWGAVSGVNQWINFSKDSYSKAEVDSLLALKQNVLTTSQLAAANSGIDSAKVAQIETNKNNISFNTNNGVKNIITGAEASTTRNNVTFTVNADGSITVKTGASGASGSDATFFKVSTSTVMTTGTWVLSGGYSASCRLQDANNNWQSGVTASEKTFTTDTTYNIFIRIQPGWTNTDGVTLYPMICPKSLYDAAPSYQPYAMSNAELTAAIQALQAQLANQ